MENFKRSVKRLVTRLTILGLVVICGAIAIAQVQKQNNVNAADNNLPVPDQLAFGDAEDAVSPLRADARQGLPARVQQVQQVQFDQPVADAAEIPAADDFIHDTQVVPTQASTDSFDSGSFDEPFPSTSSEEFDAGPPAFGDEEQGSVEAPELIGDRQIPSIAVGPTALDESQFDAGFPEDSFDTDVRDSGAAADRSRFDGSQTAGSLRGGVEPGANRFATEPAPQPNSVGNAQPDELPEPTFGSRFGATERQPSADMRTIAPAATPRPMGATAISQPEPLQSYSSSDRSTFGSLGGQADEFGGSAQQSSLSISAAGNPAPEFNGPQSASLTIHKQAPAQVHVDEPATFTIKVRNNGGVAADRVIVRDQVPKHSQLLKTDPPAKQAANGGLYWELATLAANEERTVTMQVIPKQEGVIGSVAEVSFVTLASAQADVRKPMLEVKHTTTPEVLVGETVRFAIVINNPGSGTVKDVTIEEDVPRGLAHSKGSRLEHKVGDIAPGGQRRLELSLKAAEPGTVTNVIRARGANGLVAEHTVNLQVVAPELSVVISGPSTRYLERKATFTVQLENRGTASAENIDLRVQLPRGLDFVSTQSNGRYDTSTHSIRWLLRELQPNKRAPVQLTVNPQQKGDFKIDALATADRNLRDEQEHPLRVEGLAALLFEVADQVDPIEVGGLTTYSIQVTNQGTKEASNVEFLAQVPPGMEAVQPNGVSSKYRVEGTSGIIRFDPIVRLAAKEKASYTIQVRGKTAGDQRFKVQMTSDDTTEPVIEEESTRVYSDQ